MITRPFRYVRGSFLKLVQGQQTATFPPPHDAHLSQPSASLSPQLPPVDLPVSRSTRNGYHWSSVGDRASPFISPLPMLARARPCLLYTQPSGSCTSRAASIAGSSLSAVRRYGSTTHRSPAAMTTASRSLG